MSCYLMKVITRMMTKKTGKVRLNVGNEYDLLKEFVKVHTTKTFRKFVYCLIVLSRSEKNLAAIS